MPRKKDVAVGRRLASEWKEGNIEHTAKDEEGREGGGIVAPSHG